MIDWKGIYRQAFIFLCGTVSLDISLKAAIAEVIYYSNAVNLPD